jgi:sulfite exporter TauE/SafE/copper chaperone CopZ
MDYSLKTINLGIGGMTCPGCQDRIKRRLRSEKGVKSAKVSYAEGTAHLIYDPRLITEKSIRAVTEELGYEVLSRSANRTDNNLRAVGLLILVLSLFMLLRQFGAAEFFNSFPLAQDGMGYGMLFLIGLLTSVHCVAMCGGINLSQCIPKAGSGSALRPSFLYNFGRVISYTVVGGIVGALGSVISFSGVFKGAVQLVAGVFIVIMGINMFGIFPWLKKFNPHLPKIFARKINREKGKSSGPLYIGLLNGLMPCGPLQAMQLYALSTGSPIKGALSMMLFSLGTAPLMFGLGALSSLMSKKFRRQVMTAGAVLVVVLGMIMFTQGWRLSGITLPEVADATGGNAASSKIVVKDGVQLIKSTLSPGSYPAITVQAGTPVKWVVEAPQGSVNGCNNRIIIPEYDIEYRFQTGENSIEFTPDKPGKFRYSCWMGMIRGSITVVEPK